MRLPEKVLANTCSQCDAPLLVRYDLATIGAVCDPDSFSNRSWDMWRYRELLPLPRKVEPVTLGEGMTPILNVSALGNELGFSRLFMKDEGLCPTGTFKARGASAGVSMAKLLGVEHIALPTAGNAGGAWAAYGARAGIGVTVIMPKDAPVQTIQECVAYGARTYLVDGLISDAGRIVGEACSRLGWFNASTLKEPYRIEGKKTMGLELCEQFQWRSPSVIVYPTGGGVGLIGIWKALQELRSLGWLRGSMPRLVAVQAAGCAPIVEAYHQEKEESTFWSGAETIAAGLRVPKASGDFLVLSALRTSRGTAVSVSDEDIAVKQALASRWGCNISLEGAAGLAAIAQLADEGWLYDDDEVLLINTGSGLKNPGGPLPELPVLDIDASL